MKRFGDSDSYPQSPKYARKYEENNNKSPAKPCHKRSKEKSKHDAVNKCTCGNGLSARCCPSSLAELAAKVAAAHVPYQLVEERYERIPEPVVKKLISWSFPRFEDDIRRYSALASEDDGLNGNLKREIRHSSPSHNQTEQRGAANVLSNATGDRSGQDVTFKQGVVLAKNGAVKNTVQIGFHLSGVVHEKSKEGNTYSQYPSKTVNGRAVYNVAATFDRCKVTSSTCECQFGDGIFFCRHLVALLIFRIRNPSRVIIRAPISDTLQQLSRDQLQKLTQYLLSRHSCVLPTAQEIADRFADPNSTINVLNGAPDPTAGAGFLDEDRWLLDDKHVTKHVGTLLQQSSKQSCATQLFNMLGKVKEMMKVRDCNGTRLLTLITSELISQTCSMTSQQSEVGSKLWDQIGLLWICVVLNPAIDECEKETVIEQLSNWVSESDSLIEQPFSAVSPTRITGRNVLLRAIEAKELTWTDSHLKLILRRDRRKQTGIMMSQENNGTIRTGGFANFNSKGQPLWHEQPSISCARVEALRAHGFVKEAIRLARAVARTIKGNAVENFNLFRDSQSNQQDSSPVKRNNAGSNLIGHPLNPIHILFETLNCTGKQSRQSAEFNSAALKKEAFEICILGLGEQRCLPQSACAQEEVMASEKLLIGQLDSIKLDENLVTVLRDVTTMLIEGGHASGFGKRVHRESVPVHLFTKYLFKSLLPHDRKLAFRVGLRAMRMPMLGEAETNLPELPNQLLRENGPDTPGVNRNGDPTFERSGEVPQNFYLPTPYPTTWAIMPDLENRQCELASELLQTAKGDVMLLRSIVESIQRHVRNGSHVFQLSHDAFKCATIQSATTHSDSTMLNVAMQLAMQVLQMTIQGGSWRRNEMVGWLVTCATEIGLYALLSIIKTWYTLFTPIEACQMVARCVISPNTAMRLNLSPRQREELYHDVCQMSVQSVVKDPQHCSLCSLTLCETFATSFDAVYNVIIDASAKRRIDSVQLYTIARYLDQRGLHARAFKVGYAATKRLRVPFNHDGHPGASDLLWTTQLAQSLGMKELEDMVKVIVSKVRCASVLSDVIRTCTSSISGRLPNCTGPYPNRGLRADRAPLRPLLEASVEAYVNTIHSKLSHISPRHYMEFISFLTKAQEIFMLAPDGRTQFARLLTNLKTIYKGKKKLLNLVTVSFG